jgi:hypothetical protein
VIVASERHRVSVFSWVTGDFMARFGGIGTGSSHLFCPYGVRLLEGPKPSVVVSDYGNHRLSVFSLTGEIVEIVNKSKFGPGFPYDVVECVGCHGFIVADYHATYLTKLSRTGGRVEIFNFGSCNFANPTALALSPDGDTLLVRGKQGRILKVLRSVALRRLWIAACVRSKVVTMDVLM